MKRRVEEGVLAIDRKLVAKLMASILDEMENKLFDMLQKRDDQMADHPIGVGVRLATLTVNVQDVKKKGKSILVKVKTDNSRVTAAFVTGAKYDPLKNKIVVYVPGIISPRTLLQNLRGSGHSVASDIKSSLRHELAHSRDVLNTDEATLIIQHLAKMGVGHQEIMKSVNAAGLLRRDRSKWTSRQIKTVANSSYSDPRDASIAVTALEAYSRYVNQPSELRAFLSQVVNDLKDRLDVYQATAKRSKSTSKAFSTFLRMSATWSSISKVLKPRNAKKFRTEVYRILDAAAPSEPKPKPKLPKDIEGKYGRRKWVSKATDVSPAFRSRFANLEFD